MRHWDTGIYLNKFMSNNGQKIKIGIGKIQKGFIQNI